jgi:hypothetical protein
MSIDVRKDDLYFAPARDWNALDNEHPDTNSDGVQLHLVVPAPDDAITPSREYAWLLVPEPPGPRVRVSEKAPPGRSSGLTANWSRTDAGYRIVCRLPIGLIGDLRRPFLLDAIVNDMSAERERRRGQLVMGGADGEFVYLRGDRHSADRHFAFVIDDA